MGKELLPFIQTMRIHQWIKNVFIFAMLVFGMQLTDPGKVLATILAFFTFSFASSAVYIFNDLIDLESDKQHPVKKNRPLASGRLSRNTAIIGMLILAAISLTVSIAFSPLGTTIVIGIYGLSNLLYSLYLKHIVILDVMFVGFAFIMRIFAGAYTTEMEPTSWILLCTLNVSVFLGLGKRRAEMRLISGASADSRKVLDHYSISFVDQMIAIVTSTTLVCYILYTVDDTTIERFGTPLFLYTVPFVMYGLFRYLYLLYHKETGGDPTTTILTDPSFLINILLWGLICLGIVYGNENIQEWFNLLEP